MQTLNFPMTNDPAQKKYFEPLDLSAIRSIAFNCKLLEH